MRPELFSVFGVPFHAYRTLLALAVLVCTLLAVRESRRRNLGFVIPPQTGVWALAGALLGAKSFWAIQNAAPSDWWRTVLFWEGGLVFYGGLLGGVLTSWLYFRRLGIPFVPAADTMAPYLALGEAMTRVGCFLNGCCWGAPTSMPWGVAFPPGCAAYQHSLDAGLIPPDAAHTLLLHPTQLYMVLGLLAGFAALKVILARQRRPGTAVGAYLVVYGLLRFGVEIFRADSPRFVLGLTPAQIISLGLVLFSAVFLIMRSKWTKWT